MITARRAVSIFVIVTMLYLLLIVPRAWRLASTGGPSNLLLGLVLVAVPVVAAVLLLRQLRADMVRQILTEEYQSGDDAPDEPRDRATCQAAVDSYPGDWRAWYRLGYACQAEHDRKAARAAFREAFRRHGPWDVSSPDGQGDV